MNTTNTFNSFNKDNVAATILLGALFALITAAALTSTKVDAKEISAHSTHAAPQVETIVVTATRLK